jgi:hypothetical protein
MPANTMPRTARRGALQLSAIKINKLIEASSEEVDAVGEQERPADCERDRKFHRNRPD